MLKSVSPLLNTPCPLEIVYPPSPDYYPPASPPLLPFPGPRALMNPSPYARALCSPKANTKSGPTPGNPDLTKDNDVEVTMEVTYVAENSMDNANQKE